jgi:FkbM family methyltransferase
MRCMTVITIAITAIGLTTVDCTRKDTPCQCPPTRYGGGNYHSQYYEDYILAFVFKGTEKGYYIDVGANNPDTENVTRSFYEKGWRGVNIEPNVLRFHQIKKARPRDSNYNCGIGSAEGTMTFYLPGSNIDGLATFDKEVADRLTRECSFEFKQVPVPVTTLNKIIEKASLPKINFISIDVEGFEQQVIESADLKKYRPEVLCIEATESLSTMPSYYKWEHLLFKNDYLFAMFDGLNRYYVHKDHTEILPLFIEAQRCILYSKYKRKVRFEGWDPWRK